MTTIENLRSAAGLYDFANMLGYKPNAISYILYQLSDNEKYNKFYISKKSGGKRLICAPNPHLLMLQRRIAEMLYKCRSEIDAEYNFKPISHGFRKQYSILTNAKPHRARRYILNIDLENYFPSFNFGRVRGFFIKNKHFSLNDKVATLIAQTACYENHLPQGSPCSPIIADLITHPLDIRLVQLSKKHKLFYTRYADDLTFSTNKIEFPMEIASPSLECSTNWLLGKELIQPITKAGFSINNQKTRLQFKAKRQEVTGLTVNSKVNVNAEYYRTVRAMCNSLFHTGSYHMPQSAVPLTSLNPLHGMLNFIFYIKSASDRNSIQEKNSNPAGYRELYKRFLFYRYFICSSKPLVVCEGKTDNVYLHYAIRKLTEFHPDLGYSSEQQFESKLSIFNYKNTTHDILNIGGGSGGLVHLINMYVKYNHMFKSPPVHPVIILADNDGGAKSLFSVIKQNFKKEISVTSTENFYKLNHNLYFIKTPEQGQDNTFIELLFEPKLLHTKLDGKKFEIIAKRGEDMTYSKQVFAERVVRQNADHIDFTGFTPLLNRVCKAIKDYNP